MKSPVVFIIFNRPDTTRKVFEAIRDAQPPKLLVIADGPRDDYPNDVEKCNVVRAIINVDWDCEVLTNYSDVNMGCKHRVSSGLDWAFSIVKEAIILEDDCLPHPTFFRFCDEMLEHYRDDTRIGMISGDNFQFGKKRTNYSYYFSRYLHIWGWATWRRSWKNYDIDMKVWPEIRDGRWLEDILRSKMSVWHWRYIPTGTFSGKTIPASAPKRLIKKILNELIYSRAYKYWVNAFNFTYSKQIDTWDYQWCFKCLIKNEKSIVPNVNLVSNIGFGADAVHTTKKNKHIDSETNPMVFPILHPPYLICDGRADAVETKRLFSDNSIMTKLLRRLK